MSEEKKRDGNQLSAEDLNQVSGGGDFPNQKLGTINCPSCGKLLSRFASGCECGWVRPTSGYGRPTGGPS